MALLKLCRCGKKIDYNHRYCNKCTIEVEQYNKARTQRYDTQVRNSDDNKRYTEFYNSKAWRTISNIIKKRYNGLCVICIVDRKEVTPSDTTHHIEELKGDWSQRLVEDNLIPLCHECHNKLHSNYKKENKNYLKNILLKFKDLF